ncbi:helix-turn-helix domain-containing protein [Neobacillus niacini]|uniref:helix-turn-helix domain-containing protein n=1 Tax=Neobacillus niacini TaxID=86668 RepID=UPI00203DCA89|nr:helix-turn-helix domain-containing protein [Neobacillus niacini]MCM3692882.1 helix-turn-helix domain-containing protein [Neobacillus niacini]
MSKKWWNGMCEIENILLYCLKQLNGERTIYSIFHLLNGKKSSQTLQDAHLFSLKRYFRILEPLTRQSFDEIFTNLLERKLVEAVGNQRFILTLRGQEYLLQHPQPSYINGWKYQHNTLLVWERLSLLVQVASNITFQETKYIPIQKNTEVHNWLKDFLKSTSIPKQKLGEIVYSELVDIFEQAQDMNPSLLVFRLTGYHQIGLTSMQTAKMLNMDSLQYHLAFTDSLHCLIQFIEDNPARYQMLSSLLTNVEQKNSLTLSSRKTWELLNQGFSLEGISGIRHLKISTIEDHIVEFALNIKDFSINSYVDVETQQKILEISQQEATRQLKVIRNILKETSYFQIRLVLAKNGDRQWS